VSVAVITLYYSSVSSVTDIKRYMLQSYYITSYKHNLCQCCKKR